MSKSHRVSNVTRNIRLKMSQAERAVEVCAAVWVEYGVSIRDATLAEAIELSNRQAALKERLAYSELPGLVYEPGAVRAEAYRREQRLAAEATGFAAWAGM